ncbi:glycosyltransferase family 2 protein [Nocardioides houyundeii]|uniref:glycosyltransferase family 2 protein n=1 Tax=Nocardioides houyundeii TaxID=2045452 RepID=UPI001F52CE59|nr:glycosyltransferase [Nocardioides houyundeii]
MSADPSRQVPDIACLEGLPEYDVTWPWRAPDGGSRRLAPGLTCVFRVRDEARNLPWVLPPVLDAVQHVIVVDNGSTDGTAEVAREIAESRGAGDRLTSLSYPHRVSRAGGEHLATPATSVHSLTHFYNWSFSHVRTAYSMKWDGDMVLTPEGSAILRDLSWQLEAASAIVAMPRHPLTVVDESTGWLDLSLRFLEPWIYPTGPETTFVKAFDWELREQPAGAERIVLPQGLVVEVKWLDADEFAHWRTEGVDFTTTRLYRKLREFEVDQAIREGRAAELGGLTKVTAPPGVHIIDHVTRTWLREQPRPLVTHSLPASLRERAPREGASR